MPVHPENLQREGKGQEVAEDGQLRGGMLIVMQLLSSLEPSAQTWGGIGGGCFHVTELLGNLSDSKQTCIQGTWVKSKTIP